MTFSIPLSFSDAGMADSGIRGVTGWNTGGGVWTVATSGSRAENSGSAGQPGAASDAMEKYIPYALGALALLVAFKLLRK